MRSQLEEPAFFEPVAIARFFAAGNALFLIDPARLLATYGETTGSNLLHRLTATGDGNNAFASGIAVPALGVEAGHYTVLVRSTATEEAMIPLTHIVYSTAFVLGTETGDLLLCNAERLADWRPGHAPDTRLQLPLSGFERPVHVAPGWYSVTVVAGIRQTQEHAVTADGNEEWVCAFLLDPCAEQPVFAADLKQNLNFFDP
jgi:hypothetical protein